MIQLAESPCTQKKIGAKTKLQPFLGKKPKHPISDKTNATQNRKNVTSYI